MAFLMNPLLRWTVALPLLLAGPVQAAMQPRPEQERIVRGIVRDATGLPVAGAAVRLLAPPGRNRTRTDGGGLFTVELPRGAEGRLRVEASGFRPLERSVGLADSGRVIEVVLEPAAIAEQITVTATRREARLADTASSVVVLTSEDLFASVAPALDEALRQVPGFSLFRRSGSRTANPTSQGVSLRGVGASGASRAIVLDDGVPLNDPFGGWIYWGRVPRASVERLEVLRGGASDLYGSGALGGAIQLLRRQPEAPFVALVEGSVASLGTPEGSLFAAARSGAWGAAVGAEAFRTEGYVAVSDEERGPVDARAASRHGTLDLTLDRAWARGRAFLRGSYFEDSRENGTPLQDNDTVNRQITAGADGRLGPGSFSARAFGTDQDFHQTFSAIAADRRSERLTRLQDVPSDSIGLSAQWSGGVHPRHALVAGVDARRVSGESREQIFTETGSTLVDAGGRERVAALFLEDIFAASERLTLTAALRADFWWNEVGRSSSRAVPEGTAAVTRFPDRSESALSPRLAALLRVSDAFAVSASAYRSFRTPTLNELYRSFRVGNVLTLANEDLLPERLTGAEAGVIAGSAGGRASARASVFWMEIEDAVGNVTLSITPAVITRRRQNIGRTRSAGLEVDFEARPAASIALSGGYQLADAIVESFPAERGLEGLRVPQVPRHRATLQVIHLSPSLADVVATARWTSRQFEDDQNTLALASFWTVDALLKRAVGRGIELFAGVENLFDERFEIARTPVRTVGPPRAVRGGFRLRLPD